MSLTVSATGSSTTYTLIAEPTAGLTSIYNLISSAKKTIDKLGMFGMAESLLVVVTIFFMVFKWGN